MRDVFSQNEFPEAFKKAIELYTILRGVGHCSNTLILGDPFDIFSVLLIAPNIPFLDVEAAVAAFILRPTFCPR